MRYILLVCIFSLLFLEARENPFFPTNKEDFTAIDSKDTMLDPPLKQVSIQLPSSARTLESITLRYKNLDGSIAEKSVDVERSIDWHLPIFVSQSYQSVDTKKMQKKVSKAKKKTSKKQLLALKFIQFYADGRTLYVKTKDKLLRSFLLVRPHRIVIDFQRETDLRSIVKKFKGNVFKTIRVGTHKGYYRVVVELDGVYMYQKSKTKDGYKFVLK